MMPWHGEVEVASGAVGDFMAGAAEPPTSEAVADGCTVDNDLQEARVRVTRSPVVLADPEVP